MEAACSDTSEANGALRTFVTTALFTFKYSETCLKRNLCIANHDWNIKTDPDNTKHRLETWRVLHMWQTGEGYTATTGGLSGNRSP